jgi:small conductance mechanosensitive channel
VLPAAILAISSAEQAEACGPRGDQRWICAQVYRLTGSVGAAETADALAVPLRIALVLFLAWAITRILRRVVHRMVVRIRDQGTISMLASTARFPVSDSTRMRRAQRAATVSSVLRNAISIVVWTIAILIVLGELGADLTPLIASAGVAGVALAFGTQSIVRDYLAGLFVVLEDQYGVGDEIEAGPVSGTVEWVSLRMTRIRAADGVAWYVPNGELKAVGNRSQREPSFGEPAARREGDDEESGDEREGTAAAEGSDEPGR